MKQILRQSVFLSLVYASVMACTSTSNTHSVQRPDLPQELTSSEKKTLSEKRVNAVQEIYVQGKDYLQRGELFLALRAFENALVNDPSNSEFLNARGVVLFQLGNVMAAIESFNKAIEARPEAAHFYSNRANALIRLGRVEAAASSLRTSLKLEPESPEANRLWQATISLMPESQAKHWMDRLSGKTDESVKVVVQDLPAGGAVVGIEAPKVAQDTAINSVLNLVYPKNPADPVLVKAPAAHQELALKPTGSVEPAVQLLTDMVVSITPLSPGVPPDLKTAPVVLSATEVRKVGPVVASPLPRVVVFNGNGVRGLAKKVSLRLPRHQYKTIQVANHSRFDMPSSQVFYRGSFHQEAMALSGYLGSKTPVKRKDNLGKDFDILLIVGAERVQRAHYRTVVKAGSWQGRIKS